MQFTIHYVEQTESTNDLLTKMLYGKPMEGVVVRAYAQTQGRGQQGASWESEAGKNLTFSLSLLPAFLAATAMFYMVKVGSLAVVDFLAAEGIQAAVKWPNDIYVDDKKICGMLIEQKIAGGNIAQAIVGIGLNVNQRVFLHAPNPTSMSLVDGKERDVNQCLKQLSEHIDKRYQALKERRFEELDKDYAEKMYRGHGYHNFCSSNEIFSAKIVNVKTSGELVLEKENGKQRTFAFKQVTFLQ
ncbi:MAG: biotin--[acetyl-CoA-carboxylase] ligase [Prevotellaceae bacterium]|jgi:BirA family biotin operon repressor/biotin-[acetyl-CoA-carboxylase] ligase|nr:biotin--[acetyl-CoA-carboxylase] ligase [Prevotellaceae bacterium]